MRIGLKISLGCLGIAALVGVIGWLSALTLRDVRSRVAALRQSSLREYVAATDMHVALKVAHAAAQELIVEALRTRAEGSGGPATVDDTQRATAVIDGRLVALFAHHAASRLATETAIALAQERSDAAGAEEERRELVWLDELGAQLAVHRTLLDELVAFARTDPQRANHLLEQRIEPHYADTLLPIIRQYREDAEAELDDTVTAVETVLDTSDRRNAAALVAACALAIIVGVLLTRSIARPIEALADAARRIGGADLEARVDIQRSDEVGGLANAFNQMAERLQATMVSIEEKDVLLREVHHRVKNNLQVICSLLELQAADVAATVPEVARRLVDSEQRVRSMALIHEQLYRSRDLAHVDFAAYVNVLARNVLASTGGEGRSVSLDVDVEPVPLNLDVAILCGLILNELLSNAMKHAFATDRPGTISVRFRHDEGRATLAVADDGIGLGGPTARQGTASLGLRLVRALTKQLGGETTVDGERGTRVAITFDLPAADGGRARAAVPA